MADGKTIDVTYAESHYLRFGLDSLLAYDSLDCNAAADYLAAMGFADNSLTQARKLKRQSSRYSGYHDPDAHYCDFCGCELAGAEYDVLQDGRERCIECSESVVNTRQEFETLLIQVREGMRMKYGIDIPQGIDVKVVSQKKMAKMQGADFVPTKYFDPRAIGLAVKRGDSYRMLFENGAPRAPLIATTAHELTHIWQYSHWNWEAMQARYGTMFLAVAEGMAKWSEIQYLFLLNETDYASRALADEAARTDVYGYGLRLFLNQYPMSKGIVLAGDTPFKHPERPLDLD